MGCKHNGGSNPPTLTILTERKVMICTKCGCDCVGFPSGNPEEDICMECAFPILAEAAEAGSRAMEKAHFDQTGEKKTSGEILRKIIGI